MAFIRVRVGMVRLLALMSVLGAMALLLVTNAPADTPTGSPEAATFLPDRVHGYTPQKEDGVYTYDTLFELIDGGAEVYRSFNVRLVVSRRYGKPGAPDILADIFDMGTSQDAFGAYHHDLRDGKDAGLGHESDYVGGALYFWKDRYFVSIIGFDDTEEMEQVIVALGRDIAQRIPNKGSKPELLRLLPGEGLDAARVSYFHDWTYLNTRHFLADENLLELGRDTEGILARYRSADRGSTEAGEGPFLLLLVRYSSEARAARALDRFLAGYLPNADAAGVGRREDGTWTAAQAMGEVVLVVLEAAGRSGVERLVAEVKKMRAR
ncbi:MAG: DUF6599 family protein [Acidobacteriota bacterium]